MKPFAKVITIALTFCLILSLPVFSVAENHNVIVLESVENGDGYSHRATVNGNTIKEYDYVWHIDPAKGEPYYEGEVPSGDIYIAHDIYYYPELSQDKFKQINYDGENEWAYFYEAQGLENYIFSTLPSLKSGFPSDMMHSEAEAYSNAVLHIKKAGTYTLKGNWHGQINVDLGEDSFNDPDKKVTLILDNVKIVCTVAPGIVFKEVYECDNGWEERDNHSNTVDTSDAGAVLRLADGSENTVSGTNVFRLLKAKYKDDNSKDSYPAQKKLLKTDGAVYSYRSMNIEGDGVLNITSGFEGLNSELHLTLNSGTVNINSQDDGINVNEDGVSVLTVNGGNLNIYAGLGAEGDGIDSNGYLVINGGNVFSSANPASDSGLDSDCGSYVNGGSVVSLGSAMDFATADDSKATQAVMNLRFSSQKASDSKILITDTNENPVFEYAVTGENSRVFTGAVISAEGLEVGKGYKVYINGNEQVYSGNEGFAQNMRPEKPQMQDGGQPSERPQMQDGGQPPEMPQGERPQMQFPQNFYDRGEGVGAPNCTGKTEFMLSETVNAFSGVDDIRHNLNENGVCTDCENKNTQDIPWTYCILSFIAGFALATLIFVIILLIKKTR